MLKFRKKPVVVEAVQYDGTPRTAIDILAWMGTQGGERSDGLYIETLEGTMHASAGDWIIRGVNGEFYPCKPDVFEKTYERV